MTGENVHERRELLSERRIFLPELGVVVRVRHWSEPLF
jgi:hypothetical protein